MAKDRLKDYREKRDFRRTDEPKGRAGRKRKSGLFFSVQKHDASSLHYDLRLEWDGVLLSWAVTKGPSDDPGEKRLAVRTEDHPLDYGEFEGTIPEGEYGGGTVMLWDRGTWEPLHDVDEGLGEGKLHFRVRGDRMRGGWALVKMRRGGKRENWLLIKERDDEATDDPGRLTEDFSDSVKTGRAMDEIAAGHSYEGRLPKFRDPQLATLVDAAAEGDDWLHETKFDGYRCLAALGKGGPVFYSRSGKDWSDRFGALEGAFAGLDCDSALIDGEVMAAKIQGSPFSSLQKALSEGAPLVFFAFDLLELDGENLAGKPQADRRARLETLLGDRGKDDPLRLADCIRGHGPEAYRRACEAGGEGIVSKKADAPYRGARTKAWLKVKCTRRQELVIGGYSPSDKRGRPFASLLLGEAGENGLRYRGRVGTGFDQDAFDTLKSRMRTRKTSPFDDVPRDIARDAVWVAPDLVAEVDFTEFTADGHVRHGRYLGLREDKNADEVKMERPHSGKDDDATPRVAGVSISHPDREIFPEAGCTKGDLARYYAKAGDRMIELIGHRPLALLRCPDGIDGQCFFQKHPGKGFPDALSRIAIEEKDGDKADYLYATRPESLVAAVQMGSVEIHAWGARTDRLERPDRMIFDLDPDEDLGFADVIDAAFDLRDRLSEMGLESGAMVTGGKGVHVWLPLRRTRSWDTVKTFARTFAHVLAEADPERYVATMSKKKREGRVFIDWLRNERGQTAVAPYSVRARDGAPVAVPVRWEALKTLKAANGFRLAGASEWWPEDCPALDLQTRLQTLSGDTVDALEKMSRG